MFGKPRSKILVVDDEPDYVALLKLRLEARKYEVFTANQGEEAIALAYTARPGLIVLDVMMPGMDGYQVCRRLNADPATKSIPVIFLTARSTQQHRDQAIIAGVQAYLTKPVNPDQLLKTIAQVLRDSAWMKQRTQVT